MNTFGKESMFDHNEVPTLTCRSDVKIIKKEEKEKKEFEFEILEDFIMDTQPVSVHPDHCSCIKCKPNNSLKPSSPLFAIPVEKGLNPFNNKKY